MYHSKRIPLAVATMASLAFALGACGSDSTDVDGVTTSITGTVTTLGDGDGAATSTSVGAATVSTGS